MILSGCKKLSKFIEFERSSAGDIRTSYQFLSVFTVSASDKVYLKFR